ncbi:MAG: creatininase family protein [Gemmatimonadota bacterium]
MESDKALALDELSWINVAAHLARDPRLIIPVGALEQHGPHLPLGSNVLIARSFCLDLSDEFGVLRAPTFGFGVNVRTERAYAGTASLGRKTLHRALNELLDAWEAHGVSEFILITGHRHDPHLEALATLVTTGARVRVVDIWDVPIHDLLDGQEEAEHAGEAETSLMLHLYPDLVRMDRARDFSLSREEFRRYMRGGMPSPPPGGTGCVGRPTLATAEKGRLLYLRILDAIRRAVFQEPDELSDTL